MTAAATTTQNVDVVAAPVRAPSVRSAIRRFLAAAGDALSAVIPEAPTASRRQAPSPIARAAIVGDPDPRITRLLTFPQQHS